jgi:transcriptional regulator with XRE-family HTH domain
MLRGEEGRDRREALGLQVVGLAELADVAQSNLSSWELGRRGTLSRASVGRVAKALKDVRAVRRKFRGVAIDMSDIRFLRRAIRALGRDKQPVKIEQKFGSKFIDEFRSHVPLGEEEFCDFLQIRASVLRAEVVSRPCQRWIRAWCGSIAAELGDQTLETFMAKFPSRQEGLEALARGAYARLVGEVTKAKLDEYFSRLLVTGEGAASPHDLDEN